MRASVMANIQKAAFSSSARQLKHINSVTVIGAGLMGSGIVQVAAQSNYNVTMVDTSDAALKNGQSIIAKSIKRVAKKKFGEENTSEQQAFIDKAMSNITVSTDAPTAVSATDLVVEAIVENIDTKQALFKALDQAAPSDTIFASNTSSLPVTLIAETTSADRQSRFAGLHFFNPVPAMKLVEIVRTDVLKDEVYESLVTFSRNTGKTPVECKDTPGFIVNRLLVPYMMEAFRILDRGDAKAKDIDVAMKLGAGMPMGPLELADFVGLDTMKFIIDGWAKEGKIEEALVTPSKTLDDLVGQGKLGRKSGAGVYEYSK
ncbi:l-3-hydroxyacyl-coenzyme a dehydrogenase [Zychaea mexicana]|uniref:l-3-hydroxyacyl-coenzyme a dehydrogenase n=1 Tax=Zychaea mexicana TaxID=64656 RepID=UPI0022FEDC20|nr:l-3-hydroxyacyl-coenzyme a dehydrogenase [Zychaea mexicana]KAI9489878.1 l-3-hydroxyacyl-coenzyme a dehydrogenase [Zychaea mexicana]